MDIQVDVKKSIKIRAFYLIFLIAGTQLGVGIMGAPRYIFSFARQDSWISILIAFLAMIVTVLVMFYILEQYESADIFGIQVDLFGNFIGKTLGTIYIIYFAGLLISVLLTYIQVVQIFLYPTFRPYLIGLLLFALIIYCVFGGIRAITGAAFIFFLFSQPMLFLLGEPIAKMDLKHFLPIFQASPQDILQGAKATTYSLTGFELLFLLYPFIDNKEKAKLPAILGVSYSALVLLSTTVILTGYFSLEYIQDIEWSLLTLFKSASFTFLERIDYFIITQWIFVVLPNNILLMWAITYGLKRLFNIKQRHSVIVSSAIFLVIVSLVKYNTHILKFTNFMANISFWIIFVYPFFLMICVMIKKQWRKRKGVNKS